MLRVGAKHPPYAARPMRRLDRQFRLQGGPVEAGSARVLGPKSASFRQPPGRVCARRMREEWIFPHFGPGKRAVIRLAEVVVAKALTMIAQAPEYRFPK